MAFLIGNLTQKYFFSIPSLTWISGIVSIVLFSQEKSLRWREINTHTHTHTHTHTYTHIHILQYANTGPIQRSFQNFFSIILFLLNQVRWFCCFRSGSHICYKHARHNHLRGPIELQHNWHNHLLRRKYNDIGLHYKSNWITFLVTISSAFHLYYLFEC